MKCTVCGIGMANKVERKNYPARYNGDAVDVPSVQVFHCGECGEDFLTPELGRALSVAVKNEVRKKLGLLPPERITAIREKAGFTQANLEAALGQGPKVVVRWESGKVIQSKAADSILRLLERQPNIRLHLVEIEKQRSKQQQKYGRHRARTATGGARAVAQRRSGRPL